ncbi:Receptor-type tyrosine-protein phosphatase F [Geodia barretti]|uniref:Receptor-type tyrosine-protein phosphatase F n=2 Tax=Geodia barretti TaxID=519541 RepID=A0AA35W9F1_GEOBA|nr:Receptor-type tyrosine-protein phosphatase F [Geodia barretti]
MELGLGKSLGQFRSGQTLGWCHRQSATLSLTSICNSTPSLSASVLNMDHSATMRCMQSSLTSLLTRQSYSRSKPTTHTLPLLDGPARVCHRQITVGTGVPGDVTLDGQQVNYDNRRVRLGVTYYFFVRLYSSQDDRTRFNDSAPVTPPVVIPAPPTTEDDPTVPIIAGVLGVLAFILVLVLVILLIFACRGRISDSYKVPHLRRLEDGEKGGIELRRRTRHFTPVLDVGDPNVFTSVGQPTTLVCEVSGTPAPTIKWSHEGKPLDDERFLVLADHSLFIQNTSLEDEGSYLVTAENSTGTTSAQIKVTVIKPTPPEHDESHPPVPVDNFTEYFARMTANEGDDLEEEYQDVEPDFAHTAFAAKLSINRNKNRYINIIPYDHSRVILALQENTPGSDYINASYIDGYRRNNQYIATQGPTTTTLADFWRMVWELDCPTIVMVTKLEEEDKRKCEQYWPSYGSTTYGNVQVTLKEAENLAEYSIRTFSITPLAGQSSAQMPVREVKQFHFLKWPDHGVPNYATALLHFRKRVHLYHPLKRGPMIVHCSAGVGRTGTFATVDYCMERMEGEGSVDIFNFVQQMRYKRNYMVQTAPQYEFIHEAINEAITCGDTSIKAPELKDWLAKLTPDSETGKTVLEDQFKRLETASPHDEEFDCTVAEVNKDKNRVNKHLPANDQRVVLSTENDQCDYICASYIDVSFGSFASNSCSEENYNH